MNVLDGLENYYERLVMQAVNIQLEDASERESEDFLADVVCVALNHLPPRYFRYHVDLTFYMSPQERGEMEDKVSRAVAAAIERVRSNRRENE